MLIYFVISDFWCVQLHERARSKKRLIHVHENVKKELSNIPNLTKEEKDLDTKWEAFMKAKMDKMARHGKRWMKVRYLATKASYNAAITALETQKRLLEGNLGRVAKSDLEHLRRDLERLKTDRSEIEEKLKKAHKDRHNFQDDLYRAIGAKEQSKIDTANDEIGVSNLSIKLLKQSLTENTRYVNHMGIGSAITETCHPVTRCHVRIPHK